MSRHLVMLTISLLLLLFNGGCRDRTDVDRLDIVIGIGVDRISGPNPILLTAQIVNAAAIKGPSGEGGGSQSKPFIIRTGQGKTIGEAVHNLGKDSPRRIFFSHNKFVVLGKTFAQYYIADVMDYLSRDREFRRTNKIVVAMHSAKEVLESKMDGERLPMLGLDTMLAASDQIFVYPININNFLLHLKTDVGVSYAPLVYLKDNAQDTNQSLEQAEEKSPKSSGEKTSRSISLQGMAIFKNNRLVGALDESASKNLNWFLNKVKGDTLIIPYQSTEGPDQFTVDILDGRCKIIPHITDSGITMEIVCTAQAELRESGHLSSQLKDLQLYTQIEHETEKILKTRLEQTIAIAQKELNADFLGFGIQIHNYNPAEWHRIRGDWNQLFPEIQYTVSFRVTLLKAGITKGSAISKSKGE